MSKQLIERIRELEADNKVLAALNDSFPEEIVKLEDRIAKLEAELNVYKSAAAESDRVWREFVDKGQVI